MRIWAGMLAGALLLAGCGGDDNKVADNGAADGTVSGAGSPTVSPPGTQVVDGSGGALARSSALDAAGAKDFAAVPRYPDSWIVQGATQPRERYDACGRNWTRYDLHYQSAETDNAKIVNYLTEKLTLLGWTAENEKNESGGLASTHLTKDKLYCVPAGTAYLQGVSIVARSAVDNTIVVTLTVPSEQDPFAP